MLLAGRSGWFPVGGMEPPHLEPAGLARVLLDRLHHLVLPLA
jgi:ABC-type dipeptide/oligopeptide/nickel transport system permease component